jgi:predicted nucleic acid-binding protein
MKSSTVSDSIFIDTWAWLVLANDKDPNHRLVVELRRDSTSRNAPWTTTDYVLDETLTRLFSSTHFAKPIKFVDAIFEAQEIVSLVIEHIDPDRFDKAWKLSVRYRDKPRVSFTDLTSFVAMQERRIPRVVTADAHFGQIGLGFQIIP